MFFYRFCFPGEICGNGGVISNVSFVVFLLQRLLCVHWEIFLDPLESGSTDKSVIHWRDYLANSLRPSPETQL